MSEESKAASGLLYEDDHSYITENGTLFIKENDFTKERSVAEVDPEDLKSSVEELKRSFDDLKAKTENLLESGEIDEEKLDALINEIKSAPVIGNVASLIEELEQARSSIAADESSEEPSAGESTEEAPADETSDEQAPLGEADEENPPEEEEDPLKYYQEIVSRAKELAKQSDWPFVSMELEKLDKEWSEGPQADQEKIDELHEQFQETVESFEQRKRDHYQQLNEQKKNNLEKKKSLLAELEKLIENKNWNAVGKVKKLERQWQNIGLLPSSADTEPMDEKFSELLETFKDHKVDRLVQQRQKEEDNLVGKLVVLDKMEQVASSIDDTTSDWKTIDQEFDKLTRQWKRIGRVPKEKSNEVWSRYKAAQDEYYDRKYKYDKKHRSKIDKYYHKKEQICKEAEELLEADDLAEAAREINRLHRRWKKAGNLPQRDEDKLWNRFKEATDKFNERKSENIDKLREQEEEHFEQKLRLIEEANEVKETTDWDEGHKKMQQLMDRWKEIGPVPRKKSNKIWKKFKGAMDHFYDRRREHFKEVKEQRKDNLEEKQDILEQLRNLAKHDDPIEAVNQAKPLQEEFKEAGYVPIKKKNKIWKEYREICDIIYDRFRAAKSGNKFDRELARMDLEPKQRSKIQDMRKKYKKAKKEIRQIEEEVIQYKEKKTYFKPATEDNPIVQEIQEKIDKAEEKLADKRDKLENLDRQIEMIQEEA